MIFLSDTQALLTGFSFNWIVTVKTPLIVKVHLYGYYSSSMLPNQYKNQKPNVYHVMLSADNKTKQHYLAVSYALLLFLKYCFLSNEKKNLGNL